MFAVSRTGRRWGIALALAALVGSLLPVAAASPQAAAAPSGIEGRSAVKAVASEFDPGYIISDQNFFNAGAMSEGEIQAFLNAKETGCAAGATCLKNFSQTTVSRAATPMCGEYVPDGGAESAARIIWKVAQACGISPKVILVTLQKEQGLVTATNPGPVSYRYAMGADCPDTPLGCDVAFSGFFVQVHRGAYLMKRYTQPPGTGPGTIYTDRFDLRYPVGATTAIKTHPTATCPTIPVNIRNQATHVLYIYTPYTPSAAAMAYLNGSVPSNHPDFGCSSYGNRNFWRYFTDWFGNPVIDNGLPYGKISATSTGAPGTLTVHGWAVDSSPQTGTNAIDVEIVIDGIVFGRTTANKTDAALAVWYQAFGANHAFDVTFTGVPTGTRQVCMRGVDAQTGAVNLIHCVAGVVAHCGGSIGCPDLVDRIDGADRYVVAAQVSHRAFPSGSDTAYITVGGNFPDALSGAPAATRDDAPLLLTDPNFIPDSIRAELIRLSPNRIIILGGTGAITPAVASALATIAPVERVAGDTRYATSLAVASTFADLDEVYLASGLNFPDALTAGGVGSREGRPVLLVDGVSPAPDAVLLAFLAQHGVRKITITGGPAAVSVGIETALKTAGYNVVRVGGDTRFDVSLNANASLVSAEAVYLASGLNFPDALAGSVLAAREDAPLFLTLPNCMSAALIDRIHELDPSRVVLLGGTGALWPAITTFTRCS